MGSRLASSAVVALLAAAVAAACSAGSTPPPPPASSIGGPSGPPSAALTVFAAASLKVVLARAATAYEAAHPGTTIDLSTDSSAALETKIEQGAPADVFLSADTANPQKLIERGFASGSLVEFAGNLLTVIVPKANPAGITTPMDLARPGIKVIAAGDAVPIAKYAAELVANLARQPGYPADFAAAYAGNVVSKEDNVAAVVTKVGLGEGDAGICYVTDASASTSVTTIPVPSAANVPVTYGGVVVRASANASAAAAFLAWLAGPDGQAILASFGFRPAS